MPTVHLKEKSPEFDTSRKADTDIHVCDVEGCHEVGEFKAPKNRGLNEHYHFCLTHVQEYNKKWNFFDGMNEEEILSHTLKSATWDRPTWKFSDAKKTEEKLRENVYNNFFKYEDVEREKDRFSSNRNAISKLSPEYQAMQVMGLEPPLSPQKLKDEYKKLAKKYHPDHNNGCKDAEERLKNINMAYTVLKTAYEKYETIAETV